MAIILVALKMKPSRSPFLPPTDDVTVVGKVEKQKTKKPSKVDFKS